MRKEKQDVFHRKRTENTPAIRKAGTHGHLRGLALLFRGRSVRSRGAFAHKIAPPIREIYLYMADLLIGSNDLRPLELLHWDKDYLAFFENPDADVIAGIKRDDPSNDIYAWEETDPKDIAWEYEDDFRAAYEERDKKGQEKAVGRFQKYWEKLNANPKHGPLRIAKWKNEPRYAHTLDGYGLFW